MAEFPAMPLWTDAYLGDTSHLSTIEHGAYLLLLMAMWRTASKSLPDDDRLLARYARLNTQQWARVKPILWPFFRVQEGQITQGRLTDEAAAVKRKSSKQSDKAKARWLKTKETPDAKAMPEVCQTDASLTLNPYPLEETKKEVSSRKTRERAPVRYDPEFLRVWAAYPRQQGKGAAERAWLKARKSLEFEELAEPLRAYIRAVRGTDPQFIAMLSTWLNERRWGDDPAHAANRPRTSTDDLNGLATIRGPTAAEDLARLMAPPLKAIAR